MRRLVWTVFVVLLWAPGMALADGEVGVITEVSGEVELMRGDQVLAAEAGVNLVPGDVLRTGDDATMQIDMDDGSSFALGARSSLRVHEYRMRQDHSIIAAAIDKISGWMRFAVAKLRQADYYRFKMPTAVLGVRGTEGVLNVEGEGADLQSNIMLDKGDVEVAEHVDHGRLSGKRLRLRDGEYAYRRVGRLLAMQRHFPERLKRRMPAFVKARLRRRVRSLKRRGIRPRRIEGRLFRRQRRQGIRRMQRPPTMRLDGAGMRRMERPAMRRMESQPRMMRSARPAMRQTGKPILKQQDGSATQKRPAAKRLLKKRRRFRRFQSN